MDVVAGETWIAWHRAVVAAVEPVDMVVRPVAVGDWFQLVNEVDRLFAETAACAETARKRIGKRSRRRGADVFAAYFAASDRLFGIGARLWFGTDFAPREILAEMDRVRDVLGCADAVEAGS